MSVSLKDFLDFVLLWIQKRTGVHVGDLRIYPVMVRHCLCCQRSADYAHGTSGLCVPCSEAQVCLLCSEDFTPSTETVGTFCPTCWGRMESTWTTKFQDGTPGMAEEAVRSMVTAVRPSLTGCKHQR